jgi:hypothetical protein
MAESDARILTRDDISRIASLDELLTFFKVDTTRWAVKDFRVNKWESASGSGDDVRITPLYQVRASLERNWQLEHEAAQKAMKMAVADLARLSRGIATPPIAARWRLDDPPVDPEAVMLELALMDPHIGMLAWGEEVGEDYDLGIASKVYVETAQKLLRLHKMYEVERILLVLGNDMFHVDTILNKVASTTAGTPQDFDTRLPKMFTTARRAAVEIIDAARTIAPVDVMIVPGNHDQHTMYRLGEVLSAWYRADKYVRVLNEPTMRKYYAYGKNLIGFTHDPTTGRKHDPLPLIMANEVPDLWAGSEYREIHCGHLHATSLTEMQGVRLRTLPALTATDEWHKNNGYSHHRAATALAFRHAGGLVGLHEVTP